jgi:hypothetical protein
MKTKKSPVEESDTALEDWIQSLLEQPTDALNSRYTQEQIVYDELEYLPLPKSKSRGYTVEASHVSEAVLENLHEKIRGQSCEPALWNVVVWYLAHPLPIALAHDLIDRSVSFIAMGHTRQVDEVQWRLATLVEDALYTLIRERYQQDRYSAALFEAILQQYYFSDHYEGILYMLTYFQTPSTQKKDILIERVECYKKKASKYIKKRLKQFLREEAREEKTGSGH